METSKPLPKAIVAEKAVLSVMMKHDISERVTQAVEYGLTPKWFSITNHGELFNILVQATKAGLTDWVSIIEMAKESGLEERMGGEQSLSSISGFQPHAENFRQHMDLMSQAFLRRQTIILSQRIMDSAMLSENGAEIASQASIDFAQLASSNDRKAELIPQKEALKMALDEIIARQEGTDTATIPTPWGNMNRALSGGIGIGEITFIAARPSCGKTSMAVNIIQSAAVEGYPATFISLESGVSRLAARMISAASGIAVSTLAKEKVTEGELVKITAGFKKASPWPITWRKIHSGTHHDVTKTIRKTVREHGTKIVVIDYIQKLRAADDGDRKDMRMRMDNALDAICPLADELGIALVICAQLNREAEGTIGGKLDLSMLKETSRMEQDADVIIMIGPRDEQIPSRDDYDPMTVSIPKSRDGGTGLLDLDLHGPTTTFHE